MKILVSNDDGVQSNGIIQLARAAKEFGEVTVVAPHRERSTAGHSLTLHKPLRIYKMEDNFYATSGTPADCIYLGTREVLKDRPELILSGINAGANLGTDVHYSGTVAAAREGALMNIKSYAFSLVYFSQADTDGGPSGLRFEMASEVAAEVLRKTLSISFPAHTLLNVNIPNIDPDKIKGIRVTRQGFRRYSELITKREDPRGKNYYWIGGAYVGFDEGAETDCHLVEQGYVSVTPITIDCTHNGFYTTLRSEFADL